MATEVHELSLSELLALMAGDPRPRARLEAGEQLRAVTPLQYPGRRGPVAVFMIPGLIPASGPGQPPTPHVRTVRICDGGGLLKSLEEQGMDLATDMILSKTVFHAVKQIEGGAISGGQVCLDTTSDKVPADLWRFLQLVTEIIGLRHSKYKDALLRLSRHQDAPDLTVWEDQ